MRLFPFQNETTLRLPGVTHTMKNLVGIVPIDYYTSLASWVRVLHCIIREEIIRTPFATVYL